MGYRSDVVIGCCKDAFKKFREAYENTDSLPEGIVNRICGGVYCIKWKWVKWHEEDYDGVCNLNAVMEELNSEKYSNNYKYAYKFVRIGEDISDIEITGNSLGLEIFDDLDIKTEITIPSQDSIENILHKYKNQNNITTKVTVHRDLFGANIIIKDGAHTIKLSSENAKEFKKILEKELASCTGTSIQTNTDAPKSTDYEKIISQLNDLKESSRSFIRGNEEYDDVWKRDIEVLNAAIEIIKRQA